MLLVLFPVGDHLHVGIGQGIHDGVHVGVAQALVLPHLREVNLAHVALLLALRGQASHV